MVHQWDEWLVPGTEEESLLSDGGQMTSNAQNQAPGPLPLVLGAGIAFGTITFLGFMIYLVRAWFLCVPQNRNQPALLPNQRQDTASGGNDRRGDGHHGANARPSSENKNEAPPRVPIVIIEPDATVEIAYSEDKEPVSSAEGTGARPSQHVPLWRTPTS